ncbi:glycosyltransferase family 39 protein [Celeribacter ethanolicus]|nr:glycosyltransferase family 39 protein [Celeribacter ethanolicus]
MIIMAQGFHLGYGPQLPLYNWLQAISFCLFGTNTFALTIVKNLLLATFYIALFDALKRLLPDRLALFGTLGAFLLPNMFWESQRAGTHSIALFATMANHHVWCPSHCWKDKRHMKGSKPAQTTTGKCPGLL